MKKPSLSAALVLIGDTGRYLVVFAVLVVMVLSVKHFNDWSDNVLPSGTAIASAFQAKTLEYTLTALTTVVQAIAAHLFATILALTLSVVIGAVPRIGRQLESGVTTIQSYPLVAVAPLLFAMLGTGWRSSFALAVLVAHVPLLVVTLSVLQQPVPAVEHFYSGGNASSWLLMRIRLLENVPTLTAAVVSSAPLAILGAVLAEFLLNREGIGSIILSQGYRNQLASIVVALFVLGLGSQIYVSALKIGRQRLLVGLRVVSGP